MATNGFLRLAKRAGHIRRCDKFYCITALKGGSSGYESDSSSGFSSSSSSDSDNEYESEKLYNTHIQTTSFQKLILTLGSAAAAIANPYRDGKFFKLKIDSEEFPLDMVAVLGETTGHRALAEVKKRMSSTAEGRQILEERPVINTSTINYDSLLELPENTFGNMYANFMRQNVITF